MKDFGQIVFVLRVRFGLLCLIIFVLIWLVWFCQNLFVQFRLDFHKQKENKK